MCGIWSLVNLRNKNLDPVKLFQDFYNLKHRGPDNSYFETYNNVTIGFHRLAIIDDTFSSNQPFIFEDEIRTIVFVCNGEIYNYKEIIEKYNLNSEIKSDCAVIPAVYKQLLLKSDDNTNNINNNINSNFVDFIKNDVKGEFAFTLYEFDHLKNLRCIIVGRDEVGIRPLYYNSFWRDNEYLFFSSEIKGGLNLDIPIIEFPPGHINIYTLNEFGNILMDSHNYRTIYDIVEQDYSGPEHLVAVRDAVINSVRRRLQADKPIAFLLSGGIDSSLVAAISAKILGRPISTFCCSLKGEDGKGVGTDLQYARMVAEKIGSNHTEVLFTPQEALDAIPDVIRTIESWDTTTVRASVGQYLVCKWIGENTDYKVVMVGEGPDEVCSSYLFNWYAPNGDALGICAKNYVEKIHYYDVKRADRCITRWGMEGRVALLDPEFIKAYWTIPAEKRMPTYKGMEKWWLRQAFDELDIVPYKVLWRRKEAFSDAVSTPENSWFNIIQNWVEDKVSDQELLDAKEKYTYCSPITKEAYYYRKIFCSIFGENRQAVIPGYWQPKWDKNGNVVTQYLDPSARILSIYTT